MNVVIEELEQGITAISAKVRRYHGRVDSFRQNKLNNQRQFYRELNQEEERCGDDRLVPEESKQFWGNIWSQSSDHKMIQSGYKTCEVKLMLKSRRR